jgi:hypothetical protein
LIFAPNKFETKVGGRAWSARLVDLDRAFLQGPMKTVRMAIRDGGEERSVIWPREDSATTTDAAIPTAARNP